MAGNLQESLENSGLLDERIDHSENTTVEVPEISNTQNGSEQVNTTDNTTDTKYAEKIATPKIQEEESFEVSEEFKQLDNVGEMTFEESESSMTSATQEVVGQAASSTSDFVLNNLINGAPEIGGFFTEIDTEQIEQANLSDESRAFFLNEVERVNQANKDQFKIPQWHINNIQGPLKDTFVKRGWEQSIPPELQLGIGMLFLFIWAFSTYKKISKANDYYVARLEKGIDRLSRPQITESGKSDKPSEKSSK